MLSTKRKLKMATDKRINIPLFLSLMDLFLLFINDKLFFARYKNWPKRLIEDGQWVPSK